MSIVTTERLNLRRVTLADAPFMLTLTNEPGWRQFIADHDRRTVDSAREHIRTALLPAYATPGMGFLVMTLRDAAVPIGICGLIQRAELDAPDLGFAVLSAYGGQGFALEASRAVLRASQARGCEAVCAIVSPDNARSIRLLDGLGFAPDGWHQTTPASDRLRLFRLTLSGVNAGRVLKHLKFL